MWEIITTVDNQRIIIVLLDALKRNIKAGKAVRHICAEEFNNDNGMAVMFRK